MEQRYKSETEEWDVWQEVGQRVRTPEDHRQVSILVMVLASLRGFLTITAGLRGRTPRAVLAEMDQDRVWAQQFPEVLTERLRQCWDRQEQELYEHILPQDVREKAVNSVHCNGQTWETLMCRCIETKGDDADRQTSCTQPRTPVRMIRRPTRNLCLMMWPHYLGPSFRDFLGDLTARDVLSRVQYRQQAVSTSRET